MNFPEKIRSQFCLTQLLVSYLLLGIADTIHHLHAALALGHGSALHAVAIDVVLIPMAVFAIYLFLKEERKGFLWIFLSISTLAILIPGIYHGGWNHLLKVLAFLTVDGESTRTNLLFPYDNPHYWFYEISGILEFILALICAYYTHRFIKNQTTRALPDG